MPKAYIHLYNQCSTNLKNDLAASTAFPQVEASKDAIGLLKLIQGLCCSYDPKCHGHGCLSKEALHLLPM